MTGVRSPSKHSSVEYLESIKADNYLGKAKPRKRPAPRVRNLAPNPSLEEMPTYLCMSSWSVSRVFLYLSACASIGLAFGALF